MKISGVRSWREAVQLKRPYTIAFMTFSEVELFFVELVTDHGLVGLGSASPVEEITGETAEACSGALAQASLEGLLVGQDPRRLGGLCRAVSESMAGAPAARAAVDMALHDLFARSLELPLADVLGRCHNAMATSVTIGIKDVEETLAEAEEYLGRGFRILKVKIGQDYEVDVERLSRLREQVGDRLAVRVDANQGYSIAETVAFDAVRRRLELELVEQPVSAAELTELRSLPPDLRDSIAADESLQSEHDALALAHDPSPCGIYNIKLMKSGGVTPGLGIARLAEIGGKALMWGCMDESVISISAALHAAYAPPNTRYLDLDGSFDLATDPASGGFELRDGMLYTLDEPGLGVRLEA